MVVSKVENNIHVGKKFFQRLKCQKVSFMAARFVRSTINEQTRKNVTIQSLKIETTE